MTAISLPSFRLPRLLHASTWLRVVLAWRLLHLVATGAWTDARVFWWPLGGWSFDDAPLPIVSRGWWNVPLEVIGLLLVVWIWRSAGLADPERRRWFWRTGQLSLPVRPG